ncbi:hypothetical protein Lal_00043014 [Lupinus albus]|nr:hypothetical protein Lal_00043014 [Lupinus albus]
MASSSRAKKQRTSMAHKKQGTSSYEANPLDLARLLSNDEQHKVFTKHFLGIPIFALKYGNISNFELDDFHFSTLLRQHNLFALCEESNAYYPELVRVFYCNLNLRKNRLISSMKGKEIILDMQTFSSICGNIPDHGSIKDFGIACDWDNYDRKEFYYSMCRFSKDKIDLCKLMGLGETVKNRDIHVVGNLNLEDRLLHYFLSYVRDPKVGGGVGRIREVAKNRTPILTKVNRRMKYARSGALGALDFGFTIYVFRILNDYLRI